MSVYTSLLKMSGINPYHSDYNPDVSFDDTDGFSETECLLSISNRNLNSLKSIVDEINQYYFAKGIGSEYTSLTGVIGRLFEIGYEENVHELVERYKEEIDNE
tara:strand:- start:1 stop:309 length:309 start_codon:yes stop_codon:yes gene_type:complete